MTTVPAGDPGVQSWPLRGFWRIWLWFSAMLAALLVFVGVGLTALVGLVAAVPAVILFLVGAVIGWQVLHTATAVTLGAGGKVILHRVLGPLRTEAARVRRARPSKLRSSYTPTVIETVHGWVYLIHTQGDKDALVAALQRHNPSISAET